jgi:hypothetical protein
MLGPLSESFRASRDSRHDPAESTRSGRQSRPRQRWCQSSGTSPCAARRQAAAGTQSPPCHQPQYGLSSSSQNAANKARHTEAHSRAGPAPQAPAASSNSIEATPRSYASLQPPVRMALVHAIGESSGIALAASLLAGSPHSRIYWEMDRVIFDKSAVDWRIPRRSSHGARWARWTQVRRQGELVGSLKTDQEGFLIFGAQDR